MRGRRMARRRRPPTTTSTTATTIDDRDVERAVSDPSSSSTVPLAWGTYVPAVVKYMYDTGSDPPDAGGSLFSAGYYASRGDHACARLSTMYYSSSMSSEGRVRRRWMNDCTLGCGMSENLRHHDDDDFDDDDCGTTSAATIARGGMGELGGYLSSDCSTVPARSGQLTTVMVPPPVGVFAARCTRVPDPDVRGGVRSLRRRVVAAGSRRRRQSRAARRRKSSVVAMAACSEGGENIVNGVSGRSSAWIFLFDLDVFYASRGDVLMVLAALAYTMHVVRLGAYAPRTNPLKLAAAKAFDPEAVLSVTLCVWLAYAGERPTTCRPISRRRGDVSEYFSAIVAAFAEGGPEAIWHGSSFGVSVGAILWTGWITCAYTIYAQSYGQRKVGPSDSNLIDTTQPLFSSLFAYLLLGETLGPYGYVGATLIGISLLLVSK
ncbi:hypothetical protein ACHAW5_006403 [Stephanodiscus triporus]|uniref:EamA domain-containing protein n=1 Tax=Stephanodiscus triporus TaxID=2934178 RepID=A0ABD3P2A0_9STRA